MNLVGIHGNHDLVAAARLGGGSHTSHQVLALVGQVQVDLSAHQLGDFDLSGDVAVGMLLEEFLVVLDVLRTDADLQGLANVSVQLAVGGLLLGQRNVAAGQINGELVAGLLQGAVQKFICGLPMKPATKMLQG